MNKKYIYILIGIIIIIIIGAFLVAQNSSQNRIQKNTESHGHEDLENIAHIHSIEVDAENSDILYVATHDGLFRLANNEAERVGNDRNDYMGFTSHPTRADVLFSSGHSETDGKNLGMRKSTDRGMTWIKISNGVNGPVDFHAHGMSPANPNVMYGYYDNKLQTSRDGGATWEISQATIPVTIHILPDPMNANTVTLLTWQGIIKSNDRGKTWGTAFESLGKESIPAAYIDPMNNNKIIIYSIKRGLEISTDGGTSWKKHSNFFDGNTVIELAGNNKDSKTIYALTHEEKIFKSIDGGLSWEKLL